MARTGSTWFRDSLLNGQPAMFRDFGEFLYPEQKKDLFFGYLSKQVEVKPSMFLPKAGNLDVQLSKYLKFCCRRSKSKTALFDLKLEQLDQSKLLRHPIYSFPDSKFIVLDRVNVLKQVVSRLVMEEKLNSGKREIHSTTASSQIQLLVNAEQVVAEIFEKLSLRKEYFDLLRRYNRPICRVTYEDLCDSAVRNVVVRELSEFLKIKNLSLESGLVKQTSGKMQDYVKNFSELRFQLQLVGLDYLLYLPE
jgi:hypothetical protein